MGRHTGNINQLLFEKTLQAEVLKVEKDMLKCTFQNPLILIDTGCSECDGDDGFRYKNTKLFGKRNNGLGYLEPVKRVINGETVIIDPKEACYQDHGCVDPTTKSALQPMIIFILKPYSLRATPFDGKEIKYHEGASDEFSITYKYSDSGRQRTATYSKKTTRCDRGAHEEVIWPPYKERVGFENTDAFVPGDTIRYMENVISPEIDKVNLLPETDPPATKEHLYNPDTAGSEAAWNLDVNIDGRIWADDCGGGGGGGGSVWV